MTQTKLKETRLTSINLLIKNNLLIIHSKTISEVYIKGKENQPLVKMENIHWN